jgi:hypothetical protein
VSTTQRLHMPLYRLMPDILDALQFIVDHPELDLQGLAGSASQSNADMHAFLRATYDDLRGEDQARRAS